MPRYILSVDQSTQGTKALILDENGMLRWRRDVSHRQIVNEDGWVSHDPEEIYQNLLRAVREVLREADIPPEQIACIGISNQRETTLAWDRRTGRPVCDAIVWQCSRSKDICRRLLDAGELVQARSGIPLSPYFPASKLAWILENVPQAKQLAVRHQLCAGTMDTWLLFRLTGGRAYKTDSSNASRTQLFDLERLCWSEELCGLFGICIEDLPEVCASDADFGTTTMEGIFPAPVPVAAMLGDSHAALFGQGCRTKGMAKATYGTGTSVMMNIGGQFRRSEHGLVTSLAWNCRGKTQYVMEGNINYSGAVISWLQKDVGLIADAGQTEALAFQANPEDRTCFVPAFTGLGAPYWAENARALFCGISRQTGKAELAKACLESIAFQIADIVEAMERDAGVRLDTLRVDGGATKNHYLMQFQSDILGCRIRIPEAEELSGIGAGMIAGLHAGLLDDERIELRELSRLEPAMMPAQREEKRKRWKQAVRLSIQAAE